MQSTELWDLFNNLDYASSTVRSLIRSAPNFEVELFGKTSDGLSLTSDMGYRELLASSLCHMRKDDNSQTIRTKGGGYAIVPDALFDAIVKLALAKGAFYEHCQNAFVHRGSRKKRSSDSPPKPQLEDALRALGIRGIDLWSCYARITIFRDEVKRLGWTWQKGHYSIEEYSKESALAFIKNQTALTKAPDTKHWEQTIKNLDTLNIDIVRLPSKLKQLRLNVSLSSGFRFTCPHPSIAIMSQTIQKNPPSNRWKDPEEVRSPAKTRKDSKNVDRYALGFLDFYSIPKSEREQNILKYKRKD